MPPRPNLFASLFCAALFTFPAWAQTQTAPRTEPSTNAPAVAKDPFAKWEKEISAMEAGDKASPPPKHGTLFVGSSSIRMWKTLASDFPEHKVINRGFGGSQIVDATHFADRIIFPHQPKTVVLFSGGNDINAGKSAEQVFNDFKAFVFTVHAKLPETEILFISWQPRISRWNQNDKVKALNADVEAYCRAHPRLKYIDTWTMTITPDGRPRKELFLPDNLHFNAEGYQRLAELVRPHLPKEN